MFKISLQHLQALSDDAAPKFERRVLEFIKRFLPQQSDELGVEGGRVLIAAGIAKARTYGLVQERDVVRFIILTMALGNDFEEHPALRWCKEILQDHSLNSGTRLQLIYDQLVEKAE